MAPIARLLAETGPSIRVDPGELAPTWVDPIRARRAGADDRSNTVDVETPTASTRHARSA